MEVALKRGRTEKFHFQQDKKHKKKIDDLGKLCNQLFRETEEKREEIKRLKEAIAKNRETLEKYKQDNLKELEAAKLRAQKDADMTLYREKKKFLTRFIDVFGHLEHGIENIKDENSRKGLEMLLGEFLSALKAEGVEIIEETGVPFDPGIHNAIASVDGKGEKSNTVVKIIERGFRMNGAIIKPAAVYVSK